MRKQFVCIATVSVFVLLVGAIGANPRRIEELMIGGGCNDSVDGGADIEKNGAIRTTGPVSASAFALADDAALELGAGGDFRVRYGAASDRFEVLMPGGTSGISLDKNGDLHVARHTRVNGDLTVYGALLESAGGRAISTEGLLGLWHCESASSLTDWSGNLHTGTKGGPGTVTLATGKYGNAAAFDGSSAFGCGTGVTTHACMNGDFSISVWLKRGAPPSTSEAVAGWFDASAGKTRVFIGAATGYPIFEVSRSGLYAQAPHSVNVCDGAWHHLVGVREKGAATRLYVDGALCASDTQNSTLDARAATVGFTIGSAIPGYGSLCAAVDEVSVWTRALTGDEVRSLYMQRHELTDPLGDMVIGGDLRLGSLAAAGGAVSVGLDSSSRGVLTLWDGSGGNTPGCIRIGSPNGTTWYLFVEDDGTVKVHNSLPAQNSDGTVVGTQN